jgi:flagellar hook protein FlgE
VDVYYSHTGPGTWDYHAVTDVGGVATEIATGALSFDTDGKLTAASAGPFTFSPPDATPQDITFNFGDSTGNGGTGLGGFTQFANASSTTFTNQDGFEAGVVSRVDVDAQGNVVGMFTNGQSRTVAQVAVADFEAPDKLSSVGGNLWAEQPASGQPTVGAGGEGGRGAVVSGALEQSNVDISGEFVRMIAAQRGFQANSKTISTADQLLQELISLKR